MIGDVLVIKPHHLPPARELARIICSEMEQSPKRFAMSIAGESGSGKSTLAMALKHVLKDMGIKSFIFHMDDYFHLPPTSNHLQRLEDINHVGTQEVNLELLSKHICQVKKGLSELIKPLAHYKENEIRKEIVNFDTHKVIIVEGTYTSLAKYIDKKVFIDRKYKDTYADRLASKVDPKTPFLEEVLEIEHNIIKEHKKYCHLVLDTDYEIRENAYFVELEEASKEKI